MGHRGHVEQIWWRSCDAWCAWIQAVNDSRWAREESDPLKSYEEACVEWETRLVEGGAGT
jgi:hypothetical protein